MDDKATVIYRDGIMHSLNEPAVVHDNGDSFWYLDGKLHRDDGPAVELITGDKVWYKNGIIHRDGGPAISFANGAKQWCKDDQPHRLDGPAIVYPNNSVLLWYVEGTIANTFKEFQQLSGASDEMIAELKSKYGDMHSENN